MDKQTKQLIALGVLVVAALIVAAINFGWLGGGDDPPAPTETAETPAAAPQDAGADDEAETPATGQAQADTDDEEAEEDLSMPAEVVPTRDTVDWPWESMLREQPYDPLYVQNIDVVEPGRKQEIEQLRQTWILKGITETAQRVPLRDRDGQQVMGEPLTEPKPKTRPAVVRDEAGDLVRDRNGNVVMEEKIVYEVKRDEDGEPIKDEEGNVEYVMIPKLDEFNEPVLDDDGNVEMVRKPEYVQATDEDGEPIFDEEGNPVWEQQFRRYDNGDLMIKHVPAWEERVKLDEDGEVVLDENYRPVMERVPVYEVERTEDGEPVFEDGDPVYKLEDGERIRKMVPDDTPQFVDTYVKEVWFDGRLGTFREGDRLTNTLFTITKIFLSRRITGSDGNERVRKGVDLFGDNGARITLYLTDDSRYGNVGDGN